MPVKKISIFEGEHFLDMKDRHKAIEEGRRSERKNNGRFGPKLNVHPNSVAAIASLLQEIERFDNDIGFQTNDTAASAQAMQKGLQAALNKYLLGIKDKKLSQPEKDEMKETFEMSCESAIKENLKGATQEPTQEPTQQSSFMNMIKKFVNLFLKAINCKPILNTMETTNCKPKLNTMETTNIKKYKDFKGKLNLVRYHGIAEEEIEDVQNENDSDSPGP